MENLFWLNFPKTIHRLDNPFVGIGSDEPFGVSSKERRRVKEQKVRLTSAHPLAYVNFDYFSLPCPSLGGDGGLLLRCLIVLGQWQQIPVCWPKGGEKETNPLIHSTDEWPLVKPVLGHCSVIVIGPWCPRNRYKIRRPIHSLVPARDDPWEIVLFRVILAIWRAFLPFEVVVMWKNVWLRDMIVICNEYVLLCDREH